MRKSRFTEEQLIAALKEHDAGAKVQDLARAGALAAARAIVPSSQRC